jgi:hypothetical protein
MFLLGDVIGEHHGGTGRMRRTSLVIAALIVSSVLKARTCGLTFGVVDEFGQSKPYVVEAFKGPDGPDYTSHFHHLTVAGLPCGNYKFRLTRSDIKTDLGKIVGSVFLVDQYQWLTVNPDPTLIITASGAISIDREPPKEYGLEGHVKPMLIDQGPIHVRLYELFGSRYSEVEVTPDGAFAFFRPIEGKYLLVVLRNDQALATALLSVRPSQIHPVIEISLRLPPPKFEGE